MFKKLSQILKFNRMLQESTETFRVAAVKGPDQLDKAKRLHAKVYLKHGYVVPAHLTPDGRYIDRTEDPYQDHAQYFIAESTDQSEPRVVATARLILERRTKGHDSFQTYVHQPLYQKYRDQITQLDPATCVEVSGLVKDSGVSTLAVFMLYRTMWQYSVEHGYRTWLMSCDARLYRRLKLLFGDTLQRIGPNRHFKGHEVVPIMLGTEQLLDYLVSTRLLNPLRRQIRRRLLRFFLEGITLGQLDADHRAKLGHLLFEAAPLTPKP